MSIPSGVSVVVGDTASCGTSNQISPNIRVLTGLRPPLVALYPSLWFTCGSVAANISAPPLFSPPHQKLAVDASLLLEQLESQGYSVTWTDGSAKWEGRKGWVGGYGATILGEWEECAPLPIGMKQTIKGAELMVVITVIERFGSDHRRIVVAMDSEYVYSGL